MTAPEVELRATWHRLPGAATHSHLLDGLLARLREPHRHYHSVTHVMWVLRHVEALLAEAAPSGPPPHIDGDAVRLAALYHDAVYDPRAADNEEVSARLAHEVAVRLGWPAARADLVHSLVVATSLGGEVLGGKVPDGPAHEVLLDADLAILGAAPNEYQAYVNGVRREYSHVSEPDWRIGRAGVLRHLLGLDPLYRTSTMQRSRTARARANMAAELATLD